MFLKLGDLRYNDIETLYEKQFDDFFKIWLFSEGPKMIYEKIMKHRNLTIQKFSHKCSYCMEIINDEENIKVAVKLAKEELPNIIFSEIFNKTRLNVKKI